MDRKRFFLVSFLLMLFSFSSFSPVFSKEIAVKQGPFTHFVIRIPEIIQAGSPVMLEIEARDAFDNVTTNFGSRERTFSLNLPEGLEAEQRTFSTRDLKAGSFSLSLEAKRPGLTGIGIMEGTGPVPLTDVRTGGLSFAKNVTVINGPLSRVDIVADEKMIPGYPMGVKVIALDAEGNRVLDYRDNGRGIELRLFGADFLVSPYSFVNGEARVSLMVAKSGEATLDAVDVSTGRIVGARKLFIPAPKIGRVDVEVSGEVEAGVPFTIRLTAYDTDGNLLKVYDAAGKDVVLKTNGTGKLVPDTVRPSSFVNGAAAVTVIYTKSEAITITPLVEGAPVARETAGVKEKERVRAREQRPQETARLTAPVKAEEKEVKKKVRREERSRSVVISFPKNFGTLGSYDIVEKSSRDGKSTYIKAHLKDVNPKASLGPIKRVVEIDGKKIAEVLFEGGRGEEISTEVRHLGPVQVEVSREENNLVITVKH